MLKKYQLVAIYNCNISISHGSRQTNTVDGENESEPLWSFTLKKMGYSR